MFKSPDSLVDSLAASGIDMILLANNHIYDYGNTGFLRTTQVMKDKDMLYTGARHSEEEKKYVVQDINGIKVGMINYVYETPRSDDKKELNGIAIGSGKWHRCSIHSIPTTGRVFTRRSKSRSRLCERMAQNSSSYIRTGESNIR